MPYGNGHIIQGGVLGEVGEDLQDLVVVRAAAVSVVAVGVLAQAVGSAGGMAQLLG